MRTKLVLNGPWGAGKATVGRLAAARAGLPFVDLRAPGSTSSQESANRPAGWRAAAEGTRLRQALRELPVCVLAVGEDALLNRQTRLEALEQATVVTLTAPSAVLLQRLEARGQDEDRQLAEMLRVAPEMLELRQEGHAEAHARLENTGDPQRCADLVLDVWRKELVAVAAGAQSYAVEIGHKVLSSSLSGRLSEAPVCLWVTDATVHALHGGRVLQSLPPSQTAIHPWVLEPGERSKILRSIVQVYVLALKEGADRSALVVGFGGGVVTDIAGFAAATWMRGVRWIACPTTLLGMVDASVGGKTAVDLKSAKNAVGAFWQPSYVICDTHLLHTEPTRGFVSGLAEVVKTGLIGDAGLLDLLEQQPDEVLGRDPEVLRALVRRSVLVKAHVVGRDEREGGLRAVLNLGHTVGHALEAQAGYSGLTHGEAVSLGLVAALRVGERLGRTPSSLTSRVLAILGRLGLPTELRRVDLEAAVGLIGHDKKRAGSSIRFVVAEAPGKVVVIRLPLSEVVAHTLAIAQA